MNKKAIIIIGGIPVILLVVFLLLFTAYKTSSLPPPDMVGGIIGGGGIGAGITAPPHPQFSIPPSTSAEAIDRILGGLEWGNIAFNVPADMNLQETAMIHLVLGLKKTIDELSRMLTAEAKGDREGARIRISNRMEARLSGPNFQITAVTPEEQAISANEATEWKWDIKPTSLGVQRLHLTLSAILNIDGNSTKRVIRTFDRTIQIKITGVQRASGFLQNNWQWLWAAAILPVIGWLWRRKWKKSGPNRGDQAGQDEPRE